MNEIVKLKPELAAFVEEAVASGEYGSGEAVVEEALRDTAIRSPSFGGWCRKASTAGRRSMAMPPSPPSVKRRLPG